MNKPAQVSLGIAFFVSVLCFPFQLQSLQKKLPPNYADFLSKVRHIITSQEEKTFLKLPDSEKDLFIEDFWKRRDPDPETEENEFKTEYLKRVEEAARLFAGESKAGWLTDRGRIYILFGPPINRIINTMAEDPSGRCSEVWYYGNFPVVFRDRTCAGSYKLATYDLSSLKEINLAYMQDLNLAQARARTEAQGLKTPRSVAEYFDFAWQVEKKVVEPGRIEGTIRLAIPYPGIWFSAEQGMLKTVMELTLELRDANKEVLWQDKDSFEISIKEGDLKEKQKASFSREIPFVIVGNLERLRQGKSTFHIRLKNLAGNEELRKSMEIDF